MGYSTSFEGSLDFTSEMTASQLATLNNILDMGESPHGYIDLELTKEFGGLKWNGAEKTYEMVKTVNWIIEKMQEHYPDFGLKGGFHCQGEDYDDRWRLVIRDGEAVKVEEPRIGQKVTCPLCDGTFVLESEG